MYGVSTLILWLFTRSLPEMPAGPRGKMTGKQFWGFLFAARGVSVVLSLIGLLLAVLAFTLIRGSSIGDSYLTDLTQIQQPSSPIGVILQMVSICLVAPVVEELMFRRLLLDALRPFGDKIAILYSGLAFGLMHMDMQQILYASAMGFMLGYLMVRTNNIWYCIALHFAINTSSAVMYPLMNGLDNPLVILLYVGYALLLVGISIAGIVIFIKSLKRLRLLPSNYRFEGPLTFGTILSGGGMIAYALLCVGMAVFLAVAQ